MTTTIKEALNLPDKTEIQHITGTIASIKRPETPSEKQKAAGISPQSIHIVDDDMIGIEVQIMSKDMHLRPSDRGKKIDLTASDRGNGISISTWGGHRKICLSKWAGMRVSAPSGQVDPPVKAAPQAQTGVRVTVGRAEKTMLSMADDFLNLTGHVARGLIARGLLGPDAGKFGLAGAVRTIDLARSIATTVWIEACKTGVPIGADEAAAPAVQEPEPGKENVPVAAVKSDAQVFDAIVKDCISGTVNAERAQRSVTARGLSWEAIYDFCVSGLAATFGQEKVDLVYDKMKAASVKAGVASMDNEAFCKMICCAFPTFREEVVALEMKEATANDDIPY